MRVNLATLPIAGIAIANPGKIKCENASLKTLKLPSNKESINKRPVTILGGSNASSILSATGNIGIKKAKNNIKIIAQRKLGVTTPKSEKILAI